MFLSRPCFHRTWTFQEILLSPMSIVACGFTVRSWDISRQACFLCDVHGWPRNTALELGPIMNIEYCPQKLDATATDPSRTPRLLYLLHFSMVRKATDPRDKVCALINIMQRYQEETLEINYSQNVDEVYTATARFCIEPDGGLEVLSFASGLSARSTFPSWFPDWQHEDSGGVLSSSFGTWTFLLTRKPNTKRQLPLDLLSCLLSIRKITLKGCFYGQC